MSKVKSFTEIFVEDVRAINPDFDYGKTDFNVIMTMGMAFDPMPLHRYYEKAAKRFAAQFITVAKEEVLKVLDENNIQ